MSTITLRKQIETQLQAAFPFARFIVSGEQQRKTVFHIEVNPPDVDSLNAKLLPSRTYAQKAVRLFGGKFMDASQYVADWRAGQPIIGAWFSLDTAPVTIPEPPITEEDTKPDIRVISPTEPEEEQPIETFEIKEGA